MNDALTLETVIANAVKQSVVSPVMANAVKQSAVYPVIANVVKQSVVYPVIARYEAICWRLVTVRVGSRKRVIELN